MTQERDHGLPAGGPALRRLVHIPADEFAGRVWGREPLLSRTDQLPQPFTDLLDADAVDELVSRRGLRTPFLRVARNGVTLADRDFTTGGGVGAAVRDQVSDDQLVRLFADGATLVLQGLHRVWPPLLNFAQQLAADLGHPVQVNAYVTPPQSRGFDDHYDVHDVFVLQVQGRKRWAVRPPVHPAPLRDEAWTDRRDEVRRAAQREPLLDVELAPGDCLYLPRGYLHSATALGEVSTHLTLGVHPWTRHTLAQDLLAEALAAVAAQVEGRTSLPLGPVGEQLPADEVELVRSMVQQAVQEVPASRLAAALAGRVRASQRAAPVGPLAQLRAAGELTEDPDGTGDTVALRAHLAARLGPSGSDGGAVLSSRAGDVPLGAADLAAVRQLLAAGSSQVADLGTDLSRRLLLTGIVVPA